MDAVNETQPALFASPRDFEVVAFGVPIRVSVSGPGRNELAEAVTHLFARCEVTEIEPLDNWDDLTGQGLRVVVDPDESRHEPAWNQGALAGSTLDEVKASIVSAVTFRAIEASKDNLLMLHAAGLSDLATGRTAVLVAASGTGKTSACRTLGTQFGYVTDETVALTSDLQLHRYPKPLSLLPEGQTWGKEQFSPDDLGLAPAPDKLSLGAIVKLVRDPDSSGSPVVRELTTSEAIVLLAEHTSYLASLDDPLARIAAAVRAASPAVEVVYREAEDLAPVLTELLATSQNFEGLGEANQPALAELDYDSAPFGKAFAALPRLGLYVEDAEFADEQIGVALTNDGRAVLLSAIAARVLTLIGAETTTVGPLAAALTDEFGAPESSLDHAAERFVDDVVSDLIAHGLIAHVAD